MIEMFTSRTAKNIGSLESPDGKLPKEVTARQAFSDPADPALYYVVLYLSDPLVFSFISECYATNIPLQ